MEGEEEMVAMVGEGEMEGEGEMGLPEVRERQEAVIP
jgi:hypothetical protein